MPTADEYTEAARQLRRLADRIERDSARTASTPDPARIAGGPLHDRIDHSLTIVHDALGRSHVELDRLATICERRAAVCTSYVDDLLRHRRLAGSLAVVVAPPPPPAWWVDA